MIPSTQDSEEDEQDSSNEDETENEKDENVYSDSDFSVDEEDHGKVFIFSLKVSCFRQSNR